MTQSNLERFFYRIGKTDRALRSLEKDIPEINYTTSLISEAETELELPSEYLFQADKTIEPFRWLFAFENDLRQQLREVLEERFPNDDWFDKIKLPEETRKEISKRVKNEQDSSSSSRINSDELDFCTLPELKDIIVDNWELFKENYPRGRRFIDNILRDINRYRITVAHFSRLSDSDKQSLKDKLIRFYNPLSDV